MNGCRMRWGRGLLVAMALLCQSAYAIHQGEGDLPYSQPMEHPLDKPLNDLYEGKCFFMNLGPTGIRARIDPDSPKEFLVKYVFQDSKSPAAGKIKIGDRIIGANGNDFVNPHGFHRKADNARGWQGPPYELALAIEDSQGKDGKLELIVLPGGDKSKKTTVTLQLTPVGRFSPTWPWNCPRSDKLLKDLCDFMFENGIKLTRPGTTQCLLALWASGDPRAIPLVKAEAENLAKGRANPAETGMVTWMWGYHGIFLGEYYNAFKDKSVLPAIEALNNAYELGQDWGSGGFSHRPEPYIQQRLAESGEKGYGSMAGPGGLSMLAQSIFKSCGLPYSERAYNRTHWAYILTAGANADGGLAYGFNGWDHAVIALSDPSKGKSGKGIGYICPTGMKGIGEYTIVWPTKADPRWKDTSWVADNADQNAVMESGDNTRCVYRTMIPPEPTQEYRTGPRGGGHNAPVGMGALAHYIGNKDNSSWNYLGKHMATCCANSPMTLWDGHASAQMHAFFGVLGAARADEKDFRKFLDYTKTWIILSESHDGQGLIDQPFGCQRNSTCALQKNRLSYTHIAVLLLSLPKRNLLITGADYAQPAAATTVTTTSSSAPRSAFAAPVAPPRPVLRTARTLNPDRRAILDKSLLSTLVKLSDGNELTPIPLALSVTRSKVWLKAADSNGTLTFQLAGGTQTAGYKWDALAASDHALLSILVATLKPDSSDAQAMTGVYMEAIGRVEEADKFFSKSGEDSRKKLEKLFN